MGGLGVGSETGSSRQGGNREHLGTRPEPDQERWSNARRKHFGPVLLKYFFFGVEEVANMLKWLFLNSARS